MTALRVWIAKARALFGRDRKDRRIDEEVETHLAMLAADFEDRGLSSTEARAAARRAFGGATQTIDAYRDQRGWPVVENLARDSRHGLRLLRRNPGFAVTAVLSLAVAVGATTAVFSVLDAIFFQPLPVSNPHDLVVLGPRLRDRGWILPNPVFEGIRLQQRSLSGMFAVNDAPYLRARFSEEGASFVRASLVSGSYFSVLGVSPSLGRLLTEQDDEVAQSDTCAAVLSHDFWSRRFQADPGAIGRQFQANNATCVIVGVAPQMFKGHLTGYAPEVWLPIRPLTSRRDLGNYFGAFFSGVMGRLAPGVTSEQASGDLTRAHQRIHETFPNPPQTSPDEAIKPGDVSIRLTPGAWGFDTLRSQFGRPLRILMALVALVLIIAGVNVANVTLARGIARAPELQTRAALGASTGRLVSQFLVEGMVVVLAGTAIGLASAALAAPLLASFFTLGYKPLVVEVLPNYRIAAFVASVVALMIGFVALLPAWRLVRRGAGPVMGTRWSTDTPAQQRVLRGLVVAQIALAVLLVTATGLLVKTLFGISRIDPGFRPDRVLVFELGGESRLSASTEATRDRRATFLRMLDERLQTTPGVEAAALSWLGLFGGSDLWMPVTYPGQTGRRPMARVDYVTARYFDTVGMRIVRGRGFQIGSGQSERRVAVVNETMARAHFGGDAIGRLFAYDNGAERDRPFTIVGVVAESKYNDVREAKTEPMMWLPLEEFGGIAMRYVTVRVAPGASESVSAGVKALLLSTDRDLAVRRVTPLATLMDSTLTRERLVSGFSLGFAGLAVLLSAIGLYGTLSQTVQRRRRELGVRLALGATPSALQRLVLASAAWLVGIAVLVGVPVALLSARALEDLLFGVRPNDPGILAGSVGLVAMVAFAAAYLPARRAAAVDPIEVMRGE